MSRDKTHIPPETALLKQTALLTKEYEHEKSEYLDKTKKQSIEARVKKGVCWFPIAFHRSYYNSLNQFVAEVSCQDCDNENCEFEYGKQVCFISQNYNGEEKVFTFSSTVSYVDGNRMVIVLPGQSALDALKSLPNVGVQIYFDETSYQCMFRALQETINAKGNRLAVLKETLLGTTNPTFRENYPVRMPWINRSQEAAVNKVLNAKDVAIVHGPPGTGKTTTLVEAIYETLRRETQVLVCAQSNMAVDWISEKLTDRGVNVLRIGNPTRVTNKMLSFTYERRFESHPMYSELWGMRKNVRELYCKFRTEQNRGAIKLKIDKLKERIASLEYEINESLFGEARVIACTLVGSDNKILSGRRFSSLFIDEAAQALEAASWIAIRKADRVIFAGDHCQLPPTIKCYEAERAGLGVSLMQKVAEHKPDCVSLLTTQYRMNDEIAQFSSSWFYDGKLKSAPEVKERSVLDFDTSIVWFDTAGTDIAEETVGDSFGKINKSEAELLLKEITKYVEQIGLTRVLDENIDIGIISPYKAQVYYLRQQIKQVSCLRPLRGQISINTVDGFQGQERDVIFVSMVRANEKGQIGFLNDLRRMNVAMTRARMKLAIFGNSATLSKHEFYKKLYDYVFKHGKIAKATFAD